MRLRFGFISLGMAATKLAPSESCFVELQLFVVDGTWPCSCNSIMHLLQSRMQYIRRCVNTGEVRGWLDDEEQTCASSCCRTLSHYDRNEMVARSLARGFYLLGLMQCESLALVGATLAARKQTETVFLAARSASASVQSTSCLQASRSKWL